MGVVTGRSLADLKRGDLADVFVAIDEIDARRARDGQPFLVAQVSDLSGAGSFLAFPDQNAFEAARSASRGDLVKLRARVDRAGYALQMKALELRPVATGDHLDPATIFGPLLAQAAPVAEGDVGFDIETTSAVDLDQLPRREKAKFRRLAVDDARRETGVDVPTTEALAASAGKLLALHPLTARVVSIAFHSLASGAELAVVAADGTVEPPSVTTSEAELLTTFWAVARRVRTLIGFNSRRFDVPVLLTRSALLGVRAPLDLLAHRYDRASRHVDLYDVLRGRGAAGDRRVSLELAAFTFGIGAKSTGHGSEVRELVAQGRLEELARYNIEDARATAALYERLKGTWV